MHSRPRWLTLLFVAWLAGPATAADLPHATGFEELRVSMRRLDALLADRRMTQLDIDRALLRQAATIADQAAALAAAAALLAAAQGGSASADERAAFDGFAGELAHAAEDLRAQAAGGHLNRLSARIERLRDACANCHDRFRQAPP